MTVELLPFYGLAAATLGGLLMALVSVVKLRERSENRYQVFMGVGTVLVFGGFLMQSWFILEKQFEMNILVDVGIMFGVCVVVFSIYFCLRGLSK